MKTQSHDSSGKFPMFKTADLMSTLTGIGASTIRLLMNQNEIDYMSIGNRRLLTTESMMDWYNRNKIPAKTK